MGRCVCVRRPTPPTPTPFTTTTTTTDKPKKTRLPPPPKKNNAKQQTNAPRGHDPDDLVDVGVRRVDGRVEGLLKGAGVVDAEGEPFRGGGRDEGLEAFPRRGGVAAEEAVFFLWVGAWCWFLGRGRGWMGWFRGLDGLGCVGRVLCFGWFRGWIGGASVVCVWFS